MGIPLIGALIKGGMSLFTAREDRKKTVKTAQLKIQAAKDSQDNDLALSDAEWETVAMEKTDGTWKDEYLTLLITSPLLLLLVGGVYYGFTGDPALIDGVNVGIASLATLGVDMGELMYAVVLAGIGLKVWRGR